MTGKDQTHWGATSGQAQGIRGNDFASPKILRWRPRRQQPQPAPGPANFDRTLSAKLGLIVYLIERLQEEKRGLETLIPTEQAI